MPEHETLMKCVICKQGQTTAGATTITLERGATTLVFKNVPAQICENCGEAYVDESATQSLLNKASAAADAGVEVEVLSYAA
jgi:YgiT-type zinc finger domain-containing protein